MKTLHFSRVVFSVFLFSVEGTTNTGIFFFSMPQIFDERNEVYLYLYFFENLAQVDTYIFLKVTETRKKSSHFAVM